MPTDVTNFSTPYAGTDRISAVSAIIASRILFPLRSTNIENGILAFCISNCLKVDLLGTVSKSDANNILLEDVALDNLGKGRKSYLKSLVCNLFGTDYPYGISALLLREGILCIQAGCRKHQMKKEVKVFLKTPGTISCLGHVKAIYGSPIALPMANRTSAFIVSKYICQQEELSKTLKVQEG